MMKKIILLVIAAIMLISCSTNYQKITNERIVTIEHDSCEYVIFEYDRGIGLAHKGNCKFCLERSKK